MSEHTMENQTYTLSEQTTYLIIRDGEITGSVTVKDPHPSRAVKVWRDEIAPGAKLALLVHGEPDDWLLDLPRWRA